jgi:hypothetical protein
MRIMATTSIPMADTHLTDDMAAGNDSENDQTTQL